MPPESWRGQNCVNENVEFCVFHIILLIHLSIFMSLSLPLLFILCAFFCMNHIVSVNSSAKLNKKSPAVSSKHDRTLVLNVIADSSSQLSDALVHTLAYLDAFSLACTTTLQCRAFMPSLSSMHITHLTSHQEKNMQRLRSLIRSDVQVYPPSLGSRNIGSSTDDVPEHVSEILFALKSVESEFQASTAAQPIVLSLAFSALSFPVFSSKNSVLNVFGKGGAPVLLLAKNKQLTSPSDWHDLQVVSMVLASPQSKEWLETVQRIYFHHANRSAFTLREPRAAMMESAHSKDGRQLVGYLDTADVCLQMATDTDHHSSCQASIPLSCRCPAPPKSKEDSSSSSSHKRGKHRPATTPCSCAAVTPPSNYIHHLEAASAGIGQRVGSDLGGYLKKMPESNKLGAARFRAATAPDTPQQFCWDTGDETYERRSQSRVYKNASSSVPFAHPPEYSWSSEGAGRARVVIITASGGRGLDRALHMSLSRQYYANRHGYAYQHLVSDQFANYFGDSFLDKLFSLGDTYSRNVMSKVPMILASMYTHRDRDWVVWMDDDTWINPGWMQMSLDAFLTDVPRDKLVVLGNHRSAQSNVVIIRNSREGRRLARDWLAIAVSGYVQCHGFDQGALEILIMSRLFEKQHSSEGISDPAPYNLTCLDERWVSGKVPAQRSVPSNASLPREVVSRILGPGMPLGTAHAWGCNGGADWSCDFKFEHALRSLGFVGVSEGFHRPLSSFSQGCANDFFPDFHITSETAYRPRLHVGFCSNLDEIQGTDFTYDGPLGGGNDFVRRDAVNGWMINHKSELHFYEAYRDKEACRRNGSFVPLCDQRLVHGMIEERKMRSDRLVLLTDGFAYDVEASQLCRGGGAMLAFQKKETYMKQFPEVIAAAKQFPDEEWNSRQRPQVVGEYRPISTFKKYFHPTGYCGTCTEKHSRQHGGSVLACYKPKRRRPN